MKIFLEYIINGHHVEIYDGFYLYIDKEFWFEFNPYKTREEWFKKNISNESTKSFVEYIPYKDLFEVLMSDKNNKNKGIEFYNRLNNLFSYVDNQGLSEETIIYTLFENKQIIKFVHKTFNSILKQNRYEYRDRFRIAEIGNQYQEQIYKKINSHGCCGYYDEVFEFKGKQYKIGFNFGH